MVYVILKLDAREEERTKGKEWEEDREAEAEEERDRGVERWRGKKLGERREEACLEQILYDSSLLFEDRQGLLLVDSLCE